MEEIAGAKAEAWASLEGALDDLWRLLHESGDALTDLEESPELNALPDEWLYEERSEHPEFWDGKWALSVGKDPYRVRRLEAVLDQLHDAVADREGARAAMLFKYLHEAVFATRLPYDAPLWEMVDESLDVIRASDPVLIYAPPAPAIHVPKLIVSVEEALVEAVRREPQSIFQIPSRAFEELVAEIFKRKGFAVELTKATRDGGRDIVALHEVLGIRSKYIIECKRYAEHRKVTLELVQRLYGVKMSEGANKAILATTSSFTKDAKAFASHHIWDLELKSFEDIMRWIREMGH